VARFGEQTKWLSLAENDTIPQGFAGFWEGIDWVNTNQQEKHIVYPPNRKKQPFDWQAM
jgi:hypothetical protein